MLIKVDNTGTVEGFQTIFDEVAGADGVQGLMILACDANGFKPEDVDETLKTAAIPVLGGVFPELINGKEKLTNGTIVVGIYTTPSIHIIHGLSDEDADYDELIDKEVPDLDDAQTMIVYVDGVSSRIGSLVDSLFNVFGLTINYVGGAAGSLSFVQRPCLFTNQGLIQDSAILALVDLQSGIGVSHGWERINGPFKVTEVDNNVIKSLDWKPAFEVYRQVVESASGQTFNDENFLDIANGYPFGITRVDAECIARDPIAVGEANELICLGKVPTNSYVDILSSSPEAVIDAARTAMQRGQTAFSGESANATLFIDCISRSIFLEDKYPSELEAVDSPNMPLVGALTLGEIANNGDDYLEFYNKTAVIAVFE